MIFVWLLLIWLKRFLNLCTDEGWLQHHNIVSLRKKRMVLNVNLSVSGMNLSKITER